MQGQIGLNARLVSPYLDSGTPSASTTVLAGARRLYQASKSRAFACPDRLLDCARAGCSKHFMGWTALIVALYGLAKSTLRALGSFLPTHNLATKIIKAKLAALDVAPQTFSDRCVDELAAGSIKHEPQRFAHRNLVTSEGAAFAAHPLSRQ